MPAVKEPVTLPKIRHLLDCPEARIEVFRHDSPRKAKDEDDNEILMYVAMSIVRCGDCGEQIVLKDQGKLVNDYRRSLRNGNQG